MVILNSERKMESIIDFYLFLVTDVLTFLKFYTFDLTYMFTDKLGGIKLPHLQNIKIEENPKLFAI